MRADAPAARGEPEPLLDWLDAFHLARQQAMRKVGLHAQRPADADAFRDEQAGLGAQQRLADIRKHVVDYDDVMNTQRDVIYTERRKILVVLTAGAFVSMILPLVVFFFVIGLFPNLFFEKINPAVGVLVSQHAQTTAVAGTGSE